MTLEQALRAAAVPPFHAMAMARRASELEAAGTAVRHLEVGQPASGAPYAARAAVAAAMESGAGLGYTNAPGLPTLRRRLAQHYADRNSLDVDHEAILVVAGASAGFTLAFLAAFDSGDRVGIIEPGYPCYRNTLVALGVEAVPIAVGPDTRWAPTATLLDAAGPLDGLVIASPSNPTGTVLRADRLAEITGWCATHDVQLVADEIYHGLVYDEPAPSVLATARDAVVVNSFSKYFCMTGWRLGWVVVPEHLRDAVERLQQNLYICASHVSQLAGIAALGAYTELDEHVEHYATNRLLVVDGLAAAGIADVAEADGAFYVYADLGALAESAGGSMALCERWLAEAGVATTPGLDFDLSRGHRFVRFSYAGPTDAIADALDRLQRWMP